MIEVTSIRCDEGYSVVILSCHRCEKRAWRIEAWASKSSAYYKPELDDMFLEDCPGIALVLSRVDCGHHEGCCFTTSTPGIFRSGVLEWS